MEVEKAEPIRTLVGSAELVGDGFCPREPADEGAGKQCWGVKMGRRKLQFPV